MVARKLCRRLRAGRLNLLDPAPSPSLLPDGGCSPFFQKNHTKTSILSPYFFSQGEPGRPWDRGQAMNNKK